MIDSMSYQKELLVQMVQYTIPTNNNQLTNVDILHHLISQLKQIVNI